MDQTEILTRLSVSLAIGLLVGLERGWKTRDEIDNQRVAGFRTFALTGLLGGVTGLLALTGGGIVVALAFLAYSAAFSAFAWLEARRDDNLSITSLVAGMLTFLLGALALTGDLTIPVAAAVAMTLLLALRESLHKWVASLTWEEIRAGLILLAMSFLLLPILPARAIDPWGAVNPYQIWLIAIAIAAISFGGYVAVRLFGARLGIILTALAGGLSSSTATTLAFARLGREHGQAAPLLSAGILLSGMMMTLRVGAIAIVLNRGLLPDLSLPLLAAAGVQAAGAAVLLMRRGTQDAPGLQIDNPLALGAALKLTAIIAGVSLAAEVLQRQFGAAGVLALAGLSGIADVDAISVSMSRMAGDGLTVSVAVEAILLAVAVNTAAKCVLAASSGGMRIAVPVGLFSAVALAAGLAAFVYGTPVLA